MKTHFAVLFVVLLALASSHAYSQTSIKPELDQKTVFSSLQQHLDQLNTSLDTTNITSGVMPKTGSSDAVMASRNLAALVNFTDTQGADFSQASLASFKSLDGVVSYLRQQKLKNGKLQANELKALENVNADLSIKAESCRANWWAGGLQEMKVSVFTPNPQIPDKFVGGCQIGCVEAAWYGLPGQKDQDYWLPGLSSPATDTMTPGLYYWWTVKNGVTLQVALRKEIRIPLPVDPSPVPIYTANISVMAPMPPAKPKQAKLLHIKLRQAKHKATSY